MSKTVQSTHGIDVSIVIKSAPNRVMKAFFDADALAAWWQVKNSVTTPRVLGPFVIEWATTEFRDDVLGRLGGVFRGTVMQFDGGRGFFVADAFWLPPDGEPIGPMALEVTLSPVEAPPATSSDDIATTLRVVQSGFEEGARWRRYYEIVAHGWERALHSLKMLLEK